MAKNEAKIRFSAETSDFNKSIKKSNDELASLRAEMKLNDTQMKTTGTSVEGLKKKHDLLENQLKASQDKTEALNQKLNKAAEIYGENSTEVMKLRTQLANAQTAEERIRQAIDACNNEIAEQKRVASEAESATSKLSKEINSQQSDLDALKKKYSDLVLEQGDSSNEAKKLAREIESLSGDLKQNKNALNDAAKKANELDQSFDDAGDSAGGAGEGFTVMKGVVADLASSAIQAAIGKISEFCGWLAELPEATAELRQDLSTLNTSFDDVGHSTETATDTWKELYSVFGEDDRAVETANNIAKIADNEKELNKWIDITTGAWGKHQDSLPVEGLAEAAMESAKTGSVTGVLADALNWCAKEGETYGVKLKKNIEFTKLSSKELSKLTPKQKAEYEAKKKQYEETEKYNQSLKEAKSAEEKFQFALDKCSTEQERAELITNTLNDLYSESADTYRETQGSQMEAKDATAENLLAQAELATAIEPVTTAFTELKTELMEGIQPAVEKVSEAMTDALEWAKEHPTAMKAIAGAVTVLAIGLGGLATAAAIYTAYQWAMNSAILANPITWIVVGIIAAIAALVAIIIVVIDYWDKIVAAVKKACNSLKNAVKKAFDTMKEKIKSVMNTIKNTISNIWSGIKNTISKVVDSIKSKVSSIWNGIKTATSNAFNNVKSTATSVFSKVKTAITKPIETAKDKVKGVVDSIKGFFKNMKLSFPKIKMPHFKITGKFDIKKMTVPKLGIEWYAQGGIMTRPTIFGMNGDSLMAGGEAGPEAILPISKLEDYIDNAFQRNVAYAGATYNFYLDNATVNDNAKMRSVAKDFITEMVRLGGMNR